MDSARLIKAVESPLLKIEQGLLHAFGRGPGGFSRARFFGGLRNDEAVDHIESEAWFERQDTRGDGIDGVAADLAAATRAESAAGTGIK